MEAIQHSSGDGPDTDTMMLFGGVAMAVFGTGLLLSNRTARQYLGQVSAGDSSGRGARCAEVHEAAGDVSGPVRYRIDRKTWRPRPT